MTYNSTTGDYICSSVGTPLARLNANGTYTELGDDKVFVGEADYSWMEFVRNTDNNMHNNLDKTLYQSLNNIKEGYSKMYPSLSFK